MKNSPAEDAVPEIPPVLAVRARRAEFGEKL
jgi:hypothetical protein